MDQTCGRCDRPTWIIWEATPWCREHFHEAQDHAAAAKAAAESQQSGS